ncbi:hypothetical protein V6N12_066482 [Hibiscus sabdariffa]|uniref:Uncharacterized protein n=1 Tax=Hibiscus sabdariffa TaxID=183260 RepID=A0ABR2CQA9_9ROSI
MPPIERVVINQGSGSLNSSGDALDAETLPPGIGSNSATPPPNFEHSGPNQHCESDIVVPGVAHSPTIEAPLLFEATDPDESDVTQPSVPSTQVHAEPVSDPHSIQPRDSTVNAHPMQTRTVCFNIEGHTTFAKAWASQFLAREM